MEQFINVKGRKFFLLEMYLPQYFVGLKASSKGDFVSLINLLLLWAQVQASLP